MKRHQIFNESDVSSRKHPRWITSHFLPGSNVRIAWDVLVFMVIWYNSVITPIRIFIMTGKEIPQFLISLDVAIDIIFVADAVLRNYRPYVDENTGQTVMDPDLISTRYRGSSTFWINTIACIPIVKLPISPFLSLDKQSVLSTYFNVLRMIRVLHLPGQFYELKEIRERKANVNEAVFRMYFILFFILLFMCDCGSIYFGLSTLTVVDNICPPSEDFEQVILGKEMWVSGDTVITNVMDTSICGVDAMVDCDDCPQTLFFARSIYYLMQTIFTIGYGDSVAPSKSSIEMVLACVFIIFGVFAHAMTIANMTSVLANLDVVNMSFRHEMDKIAHWMTLRSVPNQLRQQITSYFSYLNRSQHGMLDDILLRELPPHLVTELAEPNINLLTKIPFFRRERRSEEFLSLIAAKMKRRIYTPGSLILYLGEMQRELIIFKSGKAEMYLSGEQDAIESLLPGEYIGDYQLLFACANQFEVKAVEFTEVVVLTVDALFEAMDRTSMAESSVSTMRNLRDSGDVGALETIDMNTQNMKRLSTLATSILSGKSKSKKLKLMMEDHELLSHDFRIPPNSRVHVYWDSVCIVAILYYAIDFPVRIASFHRANNLESSYDAGFLIGYFFDVLFIGDMVLRSTVYSYTAHVDGKSVIVSDRTEIMLKYLHCGKFKIDLFAVIPFDLFYAFTGRFHVLFRVTKLIRVSQIPEALSKLQEDLAVCLEVETNETQKSILLMLIFSVLLIVWSSSGWNALRHDESGIISVYWVVTTLSTVGYGDVTPSNLVETCYAVVVGAVGAVFTAAIVANVTSFFHDAEISENNPEHKVKCLKRFMDRHHVSHGCAQAITEYFAYIEEEQNGLDEELMLQNNLPDNLSKNLLIQFTQPMVVACELFVDCESGLIRNIMLSMEQVFYGALYMILTRDVPSDCMYFIKKGNVDLLHTHSDGSMKIIRKLNANESFAQGCLVEKWETNPYSAKAATECELWILKRSIFHKVLLDFPRSRSMLRKLPTKSEDKRHVAFTSALSAAEKARRIHALYIDPHSSFMQAWFGLILTVTLYSVIVVPFRVSFLENHEITTIWVLIDYIGDLLFFADIIIRALLLAFDDDNNNLVVKHREIWSQYVKSGKMKWHVLSAVPVEAVVIFVPTLCPLWKLQTWSLFRLNKLLRAIEMPHLIRHVELSLGKAGVKVPKNHLKVVKLLLVILLLAHLNSCVFFAIANFNQHANSGLINSQHNWANAQGLLDSSPSCPGEVVPLTTASQQYTAALYWAMATISTVGYGDITANLNSTQEILYSTLILIVGMSVYTLVIASLEDIVSQLDVTSSLHKTKTDNINTYAQMQCLPDVLKSRILSYFDQLWRSHLGTKGEKLLKYIPDYLKSDLISGMTSPFIDKIFYIKDGSKDFVRRIIQCLSLELYLPDDYLFREGERSDVLFILYKASVDLLTSQNVKFKTVSQCVLGESSFFLFEPHICTAKAADSCEIFQLSMGAFIDALHDYQQVPHFSEYLALNYPTLENAKASIEKTIQNLKSSKMLRFLDADVETIKIPKGVLLPDSKIRFAWDIAAFIALVYIITSVPTKISFSRKFVDRFSFSVDLAVDFFFAVDVFFRLRKFAVAKDGFMITSPKEFEKIYRDDEFPIDLASSLPLSTIVYVAGVDGQTYGLCRLFQFLRILRFEKYLDCIVDFINTKTTFVVTTASLRVCQILFIIVFLSHWCCCTFYFIADHEDSQITWISSDGMQSETLGRKYLRSFYWALYTITTIGYGSVPVVTIGERVFAMITMAIGAVICDAGLTAVLASIIASKDQQAGTNNRRIQCSKLFMETQGIKNTLQTRILDYYAYADCEMRNIDEREIFNDLSPALKCEILYHFCFESLRESSYFENYSDGAIVSLIKTMTPYLAVPGECLSEIGKQCRSFYVFQKGTIQRKDSTGIITNLPEGAIIGHLATLATLQKEGLPTHELQLELLSANLPKSKTGNPYVIVKNARSRFRSQIKSTRNWIETISLKVKAGAGKVGSAEADLVIREWRKRQNHVNIGFGRIVVSALSGTETTMCFIFDEKGKNVGYIQIRTTLLELSEQERLASHEVTTTVLSFSHLYKLDVANDTSLREYLSRSKQSIIGERLPQSLRSFHDIEQSPSFGKLSLLGDS